MKEYRDIIEKYTDMHMRNERLSGEQVAECVHAIDYVMRHNGKIPRRALGLRVEYDMPLPTDVKRVVK